MAARSTVFAIVIMAVSATSVVAQDYAYPDSYGNLVIESSAGYKRILVGRGHDADKVNRFLDRRKTETEYTVPRKLELGYRDCYQPGVFVKGRSYMYGLSDGEMPVLAACR
ncbi:MAG: hypothetical protein KF874_14110 [Rhizobiaceae bacterium]|nr:hypothetical protein [Rhizobiaceae bacterium]